jgi:nucleoside-diphosphate-sugar epimerase
MKVLVTGANGFVGRALAARLAADLRLGGERIDRLHLLDLAFEHPLEAGLVRHIAGDMGDAAWLRRTLAGLRLDVVFHLASIPGGTAERQYELARGVNLDATTVLLEHGKAQVEAGGRAPVFVYASSIAVFGAMPARVTDDTLPRPAMTYGTQKLIGELLVADFSRRGWVDGRSLRLPGVLARPPARTGQLSAFMSDIIRELAAGRAFTCPTSPGATTWASSLPCVVESLIQAAELPVASLASHRSFTLPTLRFSIQELVDAIASVHGQGVKGLVTFEPKEEIEALFGRFPPLETQAAEAAGFRSDADLQALVRQALHSDGSARIAPHDR